MKMGRPVIFLFFLVFLISQCVGEIPYASNCIPPPPYCKKLTTFFDLDCYPIAGGRVTDYDKINDVLLTKVFGQNSALAEIRKILKPKLKETGFNDLEKKPAVIHLIGDNGTGKSLTGTIISENLFKFHLGRRREDQACLLYQDGQDYGPPADPYARQTEVSSLTLKLKTKIALQIKKCQKSIFIIDDIQKMMFEVLLGLTGVFEGLYENNDRKKRNIDF
jgi:hypothetical protein